MQRAGYDHKNDGSVFAPHLSVKVSELVGFLLPELVEQEVWLETAVKECQTSADFKARRLANATGFLKHIRLSMETLIQCSAARPRDCKGRIQVDAQPIYKRFFNSNRIYQVPFWQSTQFLHCAALFEPQRLTR
jgi:hypothetical protein